MRLLRCFYIIFILVISIPSARAQHAIEISHNLVDIPFPALSDTIEKRTPFKLYYRPGDLDTLKVNLSAGRYEITKMLEAVFHGTRFRFSIDRDLNVFIHPGYVVRTDLPRDFFVTTGPAGETEEVQIPPFSENTVVKDSAQSNKLYVIGNPNNAAGNNAILTGYIRNSRTGESFSGAIIYTDTPYHATITDQFGYYSLSLPKGTYRLQTSSIGMKSADVRILLHSDGNLNIELQDSIPSLKNVTIVSERRSNIRSLQMGSETLGIGTIKSIPVAFGETDVLKVLLTLPGVTSVGEASNGFNVRGGSTDQNLILLNDATIYNPSHLFGFFSAFNSDVIRDFELYKSAIPEKYGGRLSSVLDVRMRDGNTKKFSGTGGIGLLTSRFTVEGPLVKEKTTFIASGRTTYSNWLLKQIPNSAYRNSRASFGDVTVRISHTVNAKNSLYLTGYFSNDQFRLNSDTVYKYGNRNINLKWKHIFNNRLQMVAVTGLDHYHYSISSEKNPVNAFKLNSSISQGYLRADFNLLTGSKKHQLNFGFNSIYYKLKPGSFLPVGKESQVLPDVLQKEQALESALYLGDQFRVNNKLSFNAGIRFSFYNYLGPRSVYDYVAGVPRDKTTLMDTSVYGSNKIIQTYSGPEYRVVARYLLSPDASLKFSFNSLRQYIHMLTNTVSVSPTDIWKLSDPIIRPQKGYQVSLGLYKNFRSNTLETSLEFYYKQLKNYLDFKSGAVLMMNHTIETDILNTRGKAYGAELSIKKKSGKMTGWLSYTYSRTLLQLDDALAGQSINQGNYYPANFDKPHNVNLVNNYRFSHRFSGSFNIVYSTGRPVTLPIAIYYFGGGQRVYYSDRNQFRIPDYFRVDLSFTLEGNHKIKKRTHNSWSLGVYNLLARENPYSVYFIQESGFIKGYQLSVFGTAIPFITYNFRF